MTVDVVLLPAMAPRERMLDRTVVVIDVLRATTTLAAALAAGVAQVRIFEHIDEARRAADAHGPGRVLCGEIRCRRPDGFDLGNSPGQFVSHLHRGATVFMATTNGTRAIAAASSAHRVLTGALVNATAVADELAREGTDATLLCAGTDGQVAMEDLLGAGAILHALADRPGTRALGDPARLALWSFRAGQDGLPELLRQTPGGHNVIAAGLEADIEFAARLDAVPAVGRVEGDPLRVVAL